ncbi:MAG TPA: HAD-IA family hydrolase [Candidatus Binatia bacterium]
MSAFGHLVFDLDGTLVDTKDDLAAAVNVALRELRLPEQEPRVLWGYVGRGARVLIERALGRHGDDTYMVESALATFMLWYGDHLLDRSAVYPGLGEVIATLAGEGVVFSLLTNKPADMSRAIVDGLGLGATFPRLVGGDTLPVRKPDPAGLVRLIDAAGVAPGRTLMVGDSPIDVATGRNAGVATCGVLWGFSGPAIRDCGADVLVARPEELLPVVRTGVRR